MAIFNEHETCRSGWVNAVVSTTTGNAIYGVVWDTRIKAVLTAADVEHYRIHVKCKECG